LNFICSSKVNYRHEQDIYVRMIDSVTKQVRGFPYFEYEI